MKASWLLLGALLCPSLALADSYRNCNQDWTAAHSPPSRIVALNQACGRLAVGAGCRPGIGGRGVSG